MSSINDKLIIELIREIRDLNKNLSKATSDNKAFFSQVTETLQSAPQEIADFQCKSFEKKELIRQLQREILPNLPRLNNKIFTDQNFSSVFTSSKPYLQYIAENTSIGTVTSVRIYDRLGRKVNISTTAMEDLNDSVTPLVPPAQTLYISSTSTSDSNTGGATGTKQVIISGLLSNGFRVNEVVSLNGTTAVATQNQFAYLDYFSNYSIGTYGGGAIGTISAKDGSGVTTYAQIPAGGWSWRPGCFYTETNQIGYLHQYYISAFKAAVRFELFFGFRGDFGSTIVPKVSSVTNDGGLQILFPAPMVIPAAGKVLVKGLGQTTGAEAYTSFFISVEPPGHN